MTLYDDAKAAGEAAERAIIDDAFSRLTADLQQALSDDAHDEARIAELEAEVKRLQDLLDDQPPPPQEDPRRALSGIREFPHYRTKAYGWHDLALQDLGDLGVGAVSAQLNYDTPKDCLLFYERMYKEHGIKLWATVGTPRVPWTADQWAALKGILEGQLKGAVAVCANWNEPNHRRTMNDPPTTGWPNMLADQQVPLYQTVDPEGSGIEVGTGQLHSGNLPNHEGFVDQMFTARGGAMLSHSTVTTVHLYPRGGVGENLIDNFYRMYEKHTGSRLMLCTEAGYSNSMNSTQGNPVTAEESGVLVPLLFKAWHDRGGGLSLFEHFDDPDPEEDDREFNFGVVEVPNIGNPATWSRKPAFYSLQQYLAS